MSEFERPGFFEVPSSAEDTLRQIRFYEVTQELGELGQLSPHLTNAEKFDLLVDSDIGGFLLLPGQHIGTVNHVNNDSTLQIVRPFIVTGVPDRVIIEAKRLVADETDGPDFVWDCSVAVSFIYNGKFKSAGQQITVSLNGKGNMHAYHTACLLVQNQVVHREYQVHEIDAAMLGSFTHRVTTLAGIPQRH